MGEKALCLMSGGLDSTVSAAIAKESGYEIHSLTFDYGQRHRIELESAQNIARALGCMSKKTFFVDMSQIGASSLTDDIDVPQAMTAEGIRQSNAIPATYVPARNTIFLSFSLAWAEVIKACAIFIGANHLDYSGYPDCRPEYFRAFQSLADLATKSAVEGAGAKIMTPIINMDKASIVRQGIRLGAPLELTYSCYMGGKNPCGKCDSCVLRLEGFARAGYEDPLEYESH